MRYLLSLTLIALAASAHAAGEIPLKRVGWVEHVAISGLGTIVKAKMDTGATTSSMDAEIIDIRKTGEHIKGKQTGDTVVFAVTQEDGKKKTFEREVKRYVRIKQKGGGYIRRPVIAMKFCIADREIEEEVNLANREGFIYPVLVGRNMMQHAGLLIDSSRALTTRPTCDN
jgi:hypothetical protein